MEFEDFPNSPFFFFTWEKGRKKPKIEGILPFSSLIAVTALVSIVCMTLSDFNTCQVRCFG
jgi:hypothetical protein